MPHPPCTSADYSRGAAVLWVVRVLELHIDLRRVVAIRHVHRVLAARDGTRLDWDGALGVGVVLVQLPEAGCLHEDEEQNEQHDHARRRACRLALRERRRLLGGLCDERGDRLLVGPLRRWPWRRWRVRRGRRARWFRRAWWLRRRLWRWGERRRGRRGGGAAHIGEIAADRCSDLIPVAARGERPVGIPAVAHHAHGLRAVRAVPAVAPQLVGVDSVAGKVGLVGVLGDVSRAHAPVRAEGGVAGAVVIAARVVERLAADDAPQVVVVG
mmetsp:Transcript_14833/g.49244  ORF Transcript_14833/g.49244 Transcript_14833/m.49244 type:complete len:270 (-) Transcript_14833:556-1365(-)